MPKKINLVDMQEHLFEMAERLLDDEVCSDSKKLQAEIDKANDQSGTCLVVEGKANKGIYAQVSNKCLL